MVRYFHLELQDEHRRIDAWISVWLGVHKAMRGRAQNDDKIQLGFGTFETRSLGRFALSQTDP